jgi:hypothetical protein
MGGGGGGIEGEGGGVGRVVVSRNFYCENVRERSERAFSQRIFGE